MRNRFFETSVLMALAVSSSIGSAALVYPLNCERILAEKSSASAEDARWAEEILAWIAMSHPIVTSAMQRSFDTDFLNDLVHVTTGFALPPQAKRGGAMVSYSLSTKFEPVMFVANWALPNLASDAAAVLEVFNPGARVARLVLIKRIAERARQMLGAIGNQSTTRDADSDQGRPLAFSDQLVEATWIRQDLRLKWHDGFSGREIRRMQDMRGAFDKHEVAAAVVRGLHGNLASIVRAQAALVIAINGSRSAAGIHEAHRDWMKSREFSALVGFREQPPEPVPSVPAEDIAPNIAPDEDAAVAAEDLPAELSTSAPPPPLPPAIATDTRTFDSSPIDTFMAQTAVERSARLADLDVMKLWADVNRVGGVIASTLAQISRWRRDDPDWAAWRASASMNDEWRDGLNRTLSVLGTDRAHEMDQLVAAEIAFERIREWVANANAYFVGVADLGNESSKLTPRDRQALRAILEQLPSLLTLAGHAKVSIEDRQSLIFARMTAESGLTILMGNFERQRLTEGETPDVRPIRAALSDMIEQDGAKNSGPPEGATP